MVPDVVERAFGALGGSEKDESRKSPGRRPYHGRDGQGRYKAAGIGNRIVWVTVAEDPTTAGRGLRMEVELGFSDLVKVTTSDAEPTDALTGTKVLIPDLGTNPPEGLGGDGPIERLTATFGLQLQNYNAHLKYGSTEIDPDAAQANRHDVPLAAARRRTADDHRVEPQDRPRPVPVRSARDPAVRTAARHPGTRVQLHRVPAVDGFRRLQRDRPDDVQPRQRCPKAADRGRQRRAARLLQAARRTADREQVERWQEEKTYPFEGEAKDETERTVREVFNVVALSASSVVNTSDVRGRRFSLRILREALELSRSSGWCSLAHDGSSNLAPSHQTAS